MILKQCSVCKMFVRLSDFAIKNNKTGQRHRYCYECQRNRGTKTANISEMIGANIAWRRIEAEIAKCVVRCANCHRRKTAIDFGWYKSKDVGA